MKVQVEVTPDHNLYLLYCLIDRWAFTEQGRKHEGPFCQHKGVFFFPYADHKQQRKQFVYARGQRT